MGFFSIEFKKIYPPPPLSNFLTYQTYLLLAGPPGAARDYFTISLLKSPVQIDLSDQGKKIRWAVGWVLSEAELPEMRSA